MVKTLSVLVSLFRRPPPAAAAAAAAAAFCLSAALATLLGVVVGVLGVGGDPERAAADGGVANGEFGSGGIDPASATERETQSGFFSRVFLLLHL